MDLEKQTDRIVLDYPCDFAHMEDAEYCAWCDEFIPVIDGVGIHLNTPHPDGWDMPREGRC